MSQVTQHPFAAPRTRRSIRAVAAAAVLLALAAVVLTFAMGAETEPAAQRIGLPAQSSPRTDGGPEEARVAASIAAPAQSSPRTDGGPEETHVAASVGARPTVVPDKAPIAAR